MSSVLLEGPIDHPSYLTRQQINLGTTLVGASKTTNLFTPPVSNVRIRAVDAMVVIAGTGGATVALVAVGTGTVFPPSGGTSTTTTTFTTTATIGTATLSTSAAGTIFAITTDANLTLNSGGKLQAIGGTDATVQTVISAELYVDPLSSWTGY